MSLPPLNPADIGEQERKNTELVCQQQTQECQKYANISQKMRLSLTAIVLLSALSVLATTFGLLSVKDWALKLALYAGPPSFIAVTIWFYSDRKFSRILHGLRANQQKLKNITPSPPPRSRIFKRTR